MSEGHSHVEPNIEVSKTEQGNLRVVLKQEHIASKNQVEANVAHIGEEIEAVMAEGRSSLNIDKYRAAGASGDMTIIFDGKDLDFSRMPHGSLSNLGTLLTKTNRNMSKHGLRDHVEIISNDHQLKDAFKQTGLHVIARLTDPDAPTPAGGKKSARGAA